MMKIIVHSLLLTLSVQFFSFVSPLLEFSHDGSGNLRRFRASKLDGCIDTEADHGIAVMLFLQQHDDISAATSSAVVAHELLERARAAVAPRVVSCVGRRARGDEADDGQPRGRVAERRGARDFFVESEQVLVVLDGGEGEAVIFGRDLAEDVLVRVRGAHAEGRDKIDGGPSEIGEGDHAKEGFIAAHSSPML